MIELIISVEENVAQINQTNGKLKPNRILSDTMISAKNGSIYFFYFNGTAEFSLYFAAAHLSPGPKLNWWCLFELSYKIPI